MTLRPIAADVEALLGGARAAAEKKRKDADRRRWLAMEARAQWVRRWDRAVAEHGALYWRAMRFYGTNRYVTSCLRCLESIGELTRWQNEGLRKTVAWLEHGGKEDGK